MATKVGVPADWPHLQGFAAHWDKNANVAAAFDQWIGQRGYANRSEAVRDLLRARLAAEPLFRVEHAADDRRRAETEEEVLAALAAESAARYGGERGAANDAARALLRAGATERAARVEASKAATCSLAARIGAFDNRAARIIMEALPRDADALDLAPGQRREVDVDQRARGEFHVDQWAQNLLAPAFSSVE